MIAGGKPPKFEVLDEQHVRYTWDNPNPRFLPQLAGPVDPGIYRPAHYLKKFHAKYADKAKLEEEAKQQKLKSWAALHNRVDDMKEQTNPDLPALHALARDEPARRQRASSSSAILIITGSTGRAATSLCRPRHHGRLGQRPVRGESQCGRGRSPLSRIEHERHPGAEAGRENARLQDVAVALCARTELALYPNLNATDPVWRALNRDVRYRRALSLGIDARP